MPQPRITANAEGLTSSQAVRLLAEHGHNALPNGNKRTLLKIIGETLREPMFLLLIAAGTLYLVFGDITEGLTLFGAVLATLGLTLYQEGKTERAIEALRDLTSPQARVIRDSEVQKIAGREVVAGDILLLAEGDRVAADAVVLVADNLQADESLLTGEPVPVRKSVASENTPTQGNPGGDDSPFVYSGTLIVQGQATARVTATGPRSAIGKIGQSMGELETERSPLQKQTAQLVRTLAILAFGMSFALVAIYGLLRGDWLQALLAGIALAMALLPEEYPVVMTIFPALGAWRLSKVKVLTRRINAIETLGATSVLCADKTGTLTENRMTVARLQTLDEMVEIDYASAAALPEFAHRLVEFTILASAVDPFDPMEKAFHRVGAHFLAGTEHIHTNWTLVHTYALTPKLRAMAQAWEAVDSDIHVVAAKGAPEAIIELCHLDKSTQEKISAQVDTMARSGLRVLAVAEARHQGETWPETERDFDFSFLGLVALADPIRAEIPAAIKECREAGVRVIMITGDYPATAHAIATQAGLSVGDADVLSGDELALLSDAELQVRLKSTSVCARIAPEQKLRIVQALKADGEIVAMTGDGVNDAPALKAAHVGIAMGGRGTDVAREAASLVLLDDNFASIVRAIRLGRRIFDNLQKSMSYLLAVHIPIAGMALLPILLGWPIMLFPLHIAFLELIVDPACSLAFENEPAEADVMRRPPRSTTAKLFAGPTLMFALIQGLGALVAVAGAYWWGITHMTELQARAFAFSTLVVANLALILSNRTKHGSLVASLRRPNRTLWMVAAGTIALLALAIEVPALSALLRFDTPTPMALLAVVGLGVACAVWFEVVRWARKPAL
ncbi:MAG: cation-translocating P-type ATPase [Casimicrobium sp.]